MNCGKSVSQALTGLMNTSSKALGASLSREQCLIRWHLRCDLSTSFLNFNFIVRKQLFYCPDSSYEMYSFWSASSFASRYTPKCFFEARFPELIHEAWVKAIRNNFGWTLWWELCHLFIDFCIWWFFDRAF